MKRLITLHSENLFFLFLFALLIIGFLCSSVTAENGPSPLVTPGSVSGLGTMAVVNSPVPVANGGTGKTTAAAGLAALGGASLNGSSAVAFNAHTLAVASAATFLDNRCAISQVTLVPGASASLESIFNYSKVGSYHAKLSVFAGSASGWAEFYLPASAPILISSYPSPGDWSVTDTAYKICVYTVNNQYIIKNNYGSTTLTLRLMLWL